jgi:zinc transporter ZupT
MQYLLPILAVILGAAIALIIQNHRSAGVKLLLSFSGAFLLALSFFVLLPEVYEHLEARQTGLLIMFGILLQIFLEFFSKGAEHGHVHIHANASKFPILIFSSLAVHSFLEGFPIHNHDTMVYGILVHKIPIALLLTSFLIQSKRSKPSIVFFMVLFSVMTPLGTWCSSLLSVNTNFISAVNALVIGIFLHISTTILFESGEGHKFNLSKIIAIGLGIAAAYLI